MCVTPGRTVTAGWGTRARGRGRPGAVDAGDRRRSWWAQWSPTVVGSVGVITTSSPTRQPAASATVIVRSPPLGGAGEVGPRRLGRARDVEEPAADDPQADVGVERGVAVPALEAGLVDADEVTGGAVGAAGGPHPSRPATTTLPVERSRGWRPGRRPGRPPARPGRRRPGRRRRAAPAGRPRHVVLPGTCRPRWRGRSTGSAGRSSGSSTGASSVRGTAVSGLLGLGVLVLGPAWLRPASSPSGRRGAAARRRRPGGAPDPAQDQQLAPGEPARALPGGRRAARGPARLRPSPVRSRRAARRGQNSSTSPRPSRQRPVAASGPVTARHTRVGPWPGTGRIRPGAAGRRAGRRGRRRSPAGPAPAGGP